MFRHIRCNGGQAFQGPCLRVINQPLAMVTTRMCQSRTLTESKHMKERPRRFTPTTPHYQQPRQLGWKAARFMRRAHGEMFAARHRAKRAALLGSLRRWKPLPTSVWL